MSEELVRKVAAAINPTIAEPLRTKVMNGWRSVDLDAERYMAEYEQTAMDRARQVIALVREDIATQIEDLAHTHEEARERVEHGYSVEWASAYDVGVGDSAKTARKEEA